VGEGGVDAADVGEEVAEGEEGEDAGEDMGPDFEGSIAFEAAVEGEGEGHADEEEEGGEDDVDVGHAIDLGGHVVVPPGEAGDRGAVVDEDHDEHDEAAEGVEGFDATGGGIHKSRRTLCHFENQATTRGS